MQAASNAGLQSLLHTEAQDPMGFTSSSLLTEKPAALLSHLVTWQHSRTYSEVQITPILEMWSAKEKGKVIYWRSRKRNN